MSMPSHFKSLGSGYLAAGSNRRSGQLATTKNFKFKFENHVAGSAEFASGEKSSLHEQPQ